MDRFELHAVTVCAVWSVWIYVLMRVLVLVQCRIHCHSFDDRYSSVDDDVRDVDQMTSLLGKVLGQQVHQRNDAGDGDGDDNVCQHGEL